MMKPLLPGRLPMPGPYKCQVPGGSLKIRPDRLVVLCFDFRHCAVITKLASPTITATSCPLQIIRALDGGSLRQVIFDRCQPKLDCCRKYSSDLQRLFRRAAGQVHPRSDESVQGKGNIDDRIRAICERYRGSSQRVTLTVLAASLRMSPRHLSRLFRKTAQDSLMRTLRKEWLHEATRIITATSRPIEAIAEDFGYADRSSFCRSYQRVFGYYPATLRVHHPRPR